MTATLDFDRLLGSVLETGGPREVPSEFVEAALDKARGVGQRHPLAARLDGRAWPAGRPRRAARSSRVLATRLGVVGAAVVIVALAVAGAFAVLQRPSPDVAPVPSPSASPSASPQAIASAEPADRALRATWIANASGIASIGSGGGPVSLTVDTSGDRLAVDNFAPGAAFASSTVQVAPDQIRLVLDVDSATCPTGAEGVYRSTLSPDGLLLTLATVTDACTPRGEALSRTWARSLSASTFRGAGVVDTMGVPFALTLPDDAYEARRLDGFIEIGGSSGLSLDVFRNPQGFADSCSDQQVRYPYTAGAAAFVAYYRQNDAFTVVEATPLTIDGHDAIHLVTKVKTVGARCPTAQLYAWTPKDCDCHFFGADDSLYLVDVGADTFLFQISPTAAAAREMSVMSTIQIPYELPSR